MFETVLERRGRIRRAVRAFLDLSACRVFTVRQQIAAALVIGLLGCLATLAALAWGLRRLPEVPVTLLDPVIERLAEAPVTLLDPVIERAEADYSVYRLRFAWLGAEIAPCHIVAWHQSGKWTVRCTGGVA